MLCSQGPGDLITSQSKTCTEKIKFRILDTQRWRDVGFCWLCHFSASGISSDDISELSSWPHFDQFEQNLRLLHKVWNFGFTPDVGSEGRALEELSAVAPLRCHCMLSLAQSTHREGVPAAGQAKAAVAEPSGETPFIPWLSNPRELSQQVIL